MWAQQHGFCLKLDIYSNRILVANIATNLLEFFAVTAITAQSVQLLDPWNQITVYITVMTKDSLWSD